MICSASQCTGFSIIEASVIRDLIHLLKDQYQVFKYQISSITTQKMKFSIKDFSVNMTKSANDFFGKWDQIRRKLGIWSHLLKKSLMENFIFGEVYQVSV